MRKKNKKSSIWPTTTKKSFQYALLFGTFFWLTWLILTHAWFTDDAYFSFRSIDNFVNGYGLTWNVAERVQAYTHPLWFLLLSVPYFFTREIYITTIGISLALTLTLALLLIKKFSPNILWGVSAVLLLSLSSAFIDYSTSGLENPLSHLLFGIFLLLFLQKKDSPRKLFWLALVAALGALNRLDMVLFYLPPLMYEWLQQKNKWRASAMIVVGFLPLLAWEVFSIIYYGFPFPNTYYAKAQNYVPLGEEIWAGLNYFLFTLKFDPITWLIIIAPIVVVVWKKERRGLMIAAGTLLYLIYILQIGGDFMGGRFLSTAALSGAILLLVYLFPKLEFPRHGLLIPALLLVSIMGISPPYFLYAKGFETARWNGVVDERMVYFGTNFFLIEDFYAFNSNPEHNFLNKLAFMFNSIMRGTVFRWEAENDWIDLGRSFRLRAEAEGKLFLPRGANGFTGYYAGPDVYIINGLALTDSFLARVPHIYNPNWRSGHFKRVIPEGYLEVEQGSRTGLSDEFLDAYFQKIRLVVREQFFSLERWQAIWELNIQDFDDLLPGYAAQFRFPNMHYLSWKDHAEPGSSVLIRHEEFAGEGSGMQIEFPVPIHAESLEIELSGQDNFVLFFLDAQGNELGSEKLFSGVDAPSEVFQIQVPRRVAIQGFAAIRILPIRLFYQEADGEYFFNSLTIPTLL